MAILITGATGFIGSRLCLTLAEQGHTIHALCRNLHHPLLPVHNNIIPFAGDVLDKQSIKRALQNCDNVYHTAALAKMWVKDKTEFHNVNVTGTTNVLEAALLAGVHKVVHTSTCGVWGPTVKHPMTEDDPRITGFAIDYERTKYLAELEVRSFVKKGLHVVIVNPSRVYGEGPVTDSNTVSKMIVAYLKGKWRIKPANGQQVSNYAYLDDVVNGHIAAMEKGIAGNRYILGGEDVSFNSFFQHLKQISGKHYTLYNVSQELIKAYSRVEQFKTTITGMSPFFLPAFADRLKYDQKYSSNKAVLQLGYNITPFATGFAKTIQHLTQTTYA